MIVKLQSGGATFKVLHLSDTHFDPYYQEGTNAECNEPLCCRLTNGPAASPATAAGRWGDYRKCDTPKRTVDHMLQHIASTHPVSWSLNYKYLTQLIENFRFTHVYIWSFWAARTFGGHIPSINVH
jgi:hypothetical protein